MRREGEGGEVEEAGPAETATPSPRGDGAGTHPGGAVRTHLARSKARGEAGGEPRPVSVPVPCPRPSRRRPRGSLPGLRSSPPPPRPDLPRARLGPRRASPAALRPRSAPGTGVRSRKPSSPLIKNNNLKKIIKK